MLEEIKQKYSGLQLQNEDVYMATKFADFIQMAVRKLRGENGEEELVIDYVRPFIFPSLVVFFGGGGVEIDTGLLDALGKASIWSCKLSFVTSIFQVLHIGILDWKYICNVIYSVLVFEKLRDQE